MMKIFFVIVAALLSFPLVATAQGAPMTAQIERVTTLCLSGPVAECERVVNALLADISVAGNRAETLVALASSLANAADPGLPVAKLAALARALTLVAVAMPDPALSSQILALARAVGAGDSVVLQAEILLASPN